MRFWIEALVSLDAGIPSTNPVKAPVMCREGPMTQPDATPRLTPALSPLVMGISVRRVWTGIMFMKTFLLAVPGLAVGPMAMLG